MTAKQTETALLTEHLRYTPLSLVDDIINTVNELSSRAVDAAEEGLLAADPSQLGFPKSKADGDDVRERARVEIEEGVHQLETLLEANIDRKFDMFEILVLRNVLAIHPPELVPWIRLPHYDVSLPFSLPSIAFSLTGQNSRSSAPPRRPPTPSPRTTCARCAAACARRASSTARCAPLPPAPTPTCGASAR
jgi:kinetochore protein Mis12/MTW1